MSVAAEINYCKLGGLKQRKQSLTVLEERIPKSKVTAGPYSFQRLWGSIFPYFCHFWWLRHASAYGCITTVSVSVFTWSPPPLCLLSFDLGPTQIIQTDLILRFLTYICKDPLFQIKSYSQILSRNIFGEGHHLTLYQEKTGIPV